APATFEPVPPGAQVSEPAGAVQAKPVPPPQATRREHATPLAERARRADASLARLHAAPPVQRAWQPVGAVSPEHVQPPPIETARAAAPIESRARSRNAELLSALPGTGSYL